MQPDLRIPVTEEIPPDAMLEANGAVIGRIEIRVDNIFDLDDPREDYALYRFTNLIHFRTHPSVIERQLLFRSGEPFSAGLLAESERLLRGNPYLSDARIRVVHYEDNVADIVVAVHDVWTLTPVFSFSQKGGTQNRRIGVRDPNIGGSGKLLELIKHSTVDRDTTHLTYLDPFLFATRARLAMTFSSNTDGYLHEFSVIRPFYALDSRWSAGVSGREEERVDAIYDWGDIVEQFTHREDVFEISGGWSDGLVNGAARRWSVGYRYEADQFAPAPDFPVPSLLPEDRTLSYLWLGFERIEDNFKTTMNQNIMGRTEDIALGQELRLKLGFADTLLGADRRAIIVNGDAREGFELSHGRLLFADGAIAGRREGDTWNNALVDTSLKFYQPTFGRHMFFASLDATAVFRPDLENQLLLGGDNGLRGYPLRYQSGEERALVTLEQRYYTNWYPLRLARVGGAVFFDGGRIWDRDAYNSQNLGWLRDIGFGLRLSLTRSGLGSVGHIDFAFPLDGDPSIDTIQVLVGVEATY